MAHCGRDSAGGHCILSGYARVVQRLRTRRRTPFSIHDDLGSSLSSILTRRQISMLRHERFDERVKVREGAADRIFSVPENLVGSAEHRMHYAEHKRTVPENAAAQYAVGLQRAPTCATDTNFDSQTAHIMAALPHEFSRSCVRDGFPSPTRLCTTHTPAYGNGPKEHHVLDDPPRRKGSPTFWLLLVIPHKILIPLEDFT